MAGTTTTMTSNIPLSSTPGPNPQNVGTIFQPTKDQDDNLTPIPRGSNGGGRIKQANPICRVASLKKENMSADQLSELCFSKDDVLPHHSIHPTITTNSTTTSLRPQTEWTSLDNPTLLHRTTSRIGRDQQRFALDPHTNLPTTRLTVGSVPILKNGKILMVSSSSKPRWILPKGGWESDEKCEEGALRETYEEGGIVGTLGARLGDVEYTKDVGSRLSTGVGDEVKSWSEVSRVIVESNPLPSSASSQSTIPNCNNDDNSTLSSSTKRVRMFMYPFYVLEVRETWPESGRARKAVDIDTAIEMVAERPEFQKALREVKEKGCHLVLGKDDGDGGRLWGVVGRGKRDEIMMGVD